MQELVVISGKGGTGKTSLVGAIASLSNNKIMVDCDVDAADLDLILGGSIQQKHDFIASNKAFIIEEKCTDCGICKEYCRFDAIHENSDGFYIDQLACEGCDVCTHFCPEEAIDFRPIKSGEWYISDTYFGPLIHARLGIAQSNSGKLATYLRMEAKKIASANGSDLIVTDGPPGIGCPVIASIAGAGYVLIVTEPSLSAFHDMKRVLELCRHFNIEAGICINKYDINRQISDKIIDFTTKQNIEIMGKIRFDQGVTVAQVAGTTCLAYLNGETADQIRLLWRNIERRLKSIRQVQNIKSQS
jgi:MinD superfamily P-loop ATPase